MAYDDPLVSVYQLMVQQDLAREAARRQREAEAPVRAGEKALDLYTRRLAADEQRQAIAAMKEMQQQALTERTREKIDASGAQAMALEQLRQKGRFGVAELQQQEAMNRLLAGLKGRGGLQDDQQAFLLEQWRLNREAAQKRAEAMAAGMASRGQGVQQSKFGEGILQQASQHLLKARELASKAPFWDEKEKASKQVEVDLARQRYQQTLKVAAALYGVDPAQISELIESQNPTP